MSPAIPPPFETPPIPPPFETPPKLTSVEQVLKDYPGTDTEGLKRLALALARDAIFGREEMSKSSLSGRKGTKILSHHKLQYIKTLVHSRVPNKSTIDFEATWKLCRESLTKSCQTLRNKSRK